MKLMTRMPFLWNTRFRLLGKVQSNNPCHFHCRCRCCSCCTMSTMSWLVLVRSEWSCTIIVACAFLLFVLPKRWSNRWTRSCVNEWLNTRSKSVRSEKKISFEEQPLKGQFLAEAMMSVCPCWDSTRDNCPCSFRWWCELCTSKEVRNQLALRHPVQSKREEGESLTLHQHHNTIHTKRWSMQRRSK